MILLILAGLVLLTFGIFTIYARTRRPDLLGMQRSLEEHYGEGTGKLVHVFIYTGAPLVAGIGLILLGIFGLPA